MKTVAIIQSRMGSTRFPKKSLALLHGKPMLWHLVERLKQSKTVNEIVVATTEKEEDLPLVKFAKGQSIQSFQGPENDVLKRFLLCAEKLEADTIIRICGDSPLIAPELVDAVVEKHLEEKADYTINSVDGKPAVQTSLGLAVEVFSMAALRKADEIATKQPHREHVTMLFYTHPEQFKNSFVELPDYLKKMEMRLTVDTVEDLELLEKVFDELQEQDKLISLEQVVAFLKEHAEIVEQMKENARSNKKTSVR